MDENQQPPTDVTDLAEETVELAPDEPALHARPEVDPLHERDIPHTEDLQEPEGDNTLPGDSFIPTSNNRIN